MILMKKIISSLLAVMVVVMMSSFAFATTVAVAGDVSSTTSGSTSVSEVQDRYGLSSETSIENLFNLEPVTATDLGERFEERGSDLLWMMTIIFRYACYISFAVGAIKMVTGALGKRGPGPGLLLCLVSCISYVLIIHGPTIMAYFNSWLWT